MCRTRKKHYGEKTENANWNEDDYERVERTIENDKLEHSGRSGDPFQRFEQSRVDVVGIEHKSDHHSTSPGAANCADESCKVER